MSELSDLHADGVTDLGSYFIGVRDERNRIYAVLNELMFERKLCADWAGQNSLRLAFLDIQGLPRELSEDNDVLKKEQE